MLGAVDGVNEVVEDVQAIPRSGRTASWAVPFSSYRPETLAPSKPEMVFDPRLRRKRALGSG